MINFKTLLICFFVLNSFYVISQHKETNIELCEVELVSGEFRLILDSIILHEKYCDYYSKDLFFTIRIKRQLLNYAIIEIVPQIDKNISLRMQPYGFFYYQNYLFLLFDNKLDEVFVPKDNGKVFEYLEYDFFYREYTPDGRLILREIIDDSFTIWLYEYFNEDFYLKYKDPSCE